MAVNLYDYANQLEQASFIFCLCQIELISLI